jgi:hypothetical protein
VTSNIACPDSGEIFGAGAATARECMLKTYMSEKIFAHQEFTDGLVHKIFILAS